MLEKITVRFLYYTSKVILILSIIFLIAANFTASWALRIPLIIVISYITLISVKPYFELEELKIKQLEDEAKDKNTEK